jgi:hypothetical protein
MPRTLSALSPRSQAYVRGGGARNYGNYSNFAADNPYQRAGVGPGTENDIGGAGWGNDPLMKLLGGMFTPQGGGGTMWGGAGEGGWLGGGGGGDLAATLLGAGGGAGGAAAGGGNAQTEMLQALRDLYREQLPFAREQLAKQPTVREAFSAQREAKDPVGWANKMRSIPGYEWGPGGAFEGRRAQDLYSPAAILATQGNTAENQLAQLGGRKGITPEEMRDFNRKVKLSRRSYM